MDNYSYNGIPGLIGGSIMSQIIELEEPLSSAKIIIDYDGVIPAECSVNIYYRLDPEDNTEWVDYIDEMTLGLNLKFASYQYKIEMTTTDATKSPIIKSIKVESNNQESIVSKIKSTGVGNIKIPIAGLFIDNIVSITLDYISFNSSSGTSMELYDSRDNLIKKMNIGKSGPYIYFFDSEDEVDYIKIIFSAINQSIDSLKVGSLNKYFNSKEYSSSGIKAYSSPTYYNNKGERINTLIDNLGDEINIVGMKESDYTSIFDSTPYWLSLSNKDLNIRSHKLILDESFRKENPLINLSLGYDELIIYKGDGLDNSNRKVFIGGVIGDTLDGASKITLEYGMIGGSLAASEEYKVKIQDLNEKHVQYGYGTITMDDVSGKLIPFSKTFSPNTIMSGTRNIRYACYASNSWDDTSASNIDISWNTEDAMPVKHKSIYHSPLKIEGEPEPSFADIKIVIKNGIINSNKIGEKILRVIKKSYREKHLARVNELLSTPYINSNFNFPSIVGNSISHNHSLEINTARDVESDLLINPDLVNYKLEGNKLTISSDYKGYKNSISFISQNLPVIVGTVTDELSYTSEWKELSIENCDLSKVYLKTDVDNMKLTARIERQNTEDVSGKHYMYRATISSNKYNPRINYIPSINSGEYNIGNEKYIFLASPEKIEIGDALEPQFQGIKFIPRDGTYYAYKPKLIENLFSEVSFKSDGSKMKILETKISAYPSSELFPDKKLIPINEGEI